MNKRRNRLVWPWVLVGFVLFCGLLVVVPGLVTGIGPYDLPTRSRELDGIIAESKRLGLPMTAAELVGEVPPADDNAAPRVRQLLQALPKPPNVTVTSDPALQGQLESWLSSYGKELDEVSKLVREKQGWYIERDWDMGPYLLFPEFSDLKGIAKALVGRGVMRAKKGQVDLAIEDFVAAREISRKVVNEPFLIALLVSIAIDSISLTAVEHYVASWKGDATKLRKLEEAIIRTQCKKDPTHALQGEFFFNINICRNLKVFGGMNAIAGFSSGTVTAPPHPSALIRDGLPNGMFERASLAAMADIWNEVFTEINAKGIREAKWAETVDKRVILMESDSKTSEMLALVLFPAFSQADVALHNDDVSQDLALAFVRSFRFQAEKGRWPKSLAEIDCAFPDPLNQGKPIQATFSEHQVRLWSVGRNKTDDGGRYRGEDPQSKADDTVYVWPARRPRP